MADTEFTIMGETTRYGSWKEAPLKLRDNEDGTFALAVDPLVASELAAIKALLEEVKTLLSNPLDVSLV